MPTSGADLDDARRLTVARGLVRAAFAHITVDAMMELPFEALGPTKTLLKRFFSSDAWGPGDDVALASAVGPGDGTWRHDLDPELVLRYGWEGGRFGLRVQATAAAADDEAPGNSPAGFGVAPVRAGGSDACRTAERARSDDPLAGTFDGPVVPEATPNPRSIRFQVGPIAASPHLGGIRRWYESAAAAADDPAAARLFAEFDDVANVLVGPDFVAVGLLRAADWERLLRPVLDVVTDEFADPDAPPDTSGPRVMGGPAGAGMVGPAGAPPTGRAPDDPAADAPAAPEGPRRVPRLSRLERAWHELGSLRPGADAADLALVQAAAAGDDPARRQVAANLLGEADPEVAATHWARLVVDPVRSVRRAAADAMVDAGRPELRPLLETALADADAWVRWKALRGLSELGVGPSRTPVAALAEDPDFRIRLEVAAALRRA